MSRSDTIATYFMRVSQLRDQLLAIGESVDDGELVSIALNDLPTSWEPFIQGVCAQAKLPSFDRLWTNCVQEEGRIMNKSGPPSEENQALATNARKGKGKKFSYKKNKDKKPTPDQEQRTRDLSKV